MASEVLVVNPGKRKRKSTRRRKTTAKRKTPARRKTTTRRRKTTTRAVAKPRKRRVVQTMAKRKRVTRRKPARKNPRKRRAPRRTARRAGRAIAQSFMGLNVKKALGNVVYFQIGMFAAKWASKRFDDSSETDPSTWTWATYLKGALGAVAAGVLVNGFKRGSGQRVLEGGLNLMAYKAIQNELIAPNAWAQGQFGADDYVPTEYLLTGDEDYPMGYDDNGNYMPVDDRHRLPTVAEMDGDSLVEVGPLGNVLAPVGPLGGNPWAEALIAS